MLHILFSIISWNFRFVDGICSISMLLLRMMHHPPPVDQEIRIPDTDLGFTSAYAATDLTLSCVCVFQKWFEPVYWYIDCVFLLHGGLVGAVYAITWMISGSWLAGLLSAAFYIFNKYVKWPVIQLVLLRFSRLLWLYWLTFYSAEWQKLFRSVSIINYIYNKPNGTSLTYVIDRSMWGGCSIGDS